MTDLYSGQLTDLLQNESEYNTEIEALAYATLQEKQRIMDEADKTRTLAMIDQLPEDVLDVLAVELRSPYYSDDMTIEQKRTIIKNILVWFYHAGTPAAVAEMAAAIFGSGQVVEWFDFDPNDGEIVPGEFDVETSGEMQDPLVFMEQINRIIGRVKNTRSHLRMVRFLRIVHVPEAAVILPQHYAVNPISNVIRETKEAGPSIGAATFAQASPAVTIRNVLDELTQISVILPAAAFAQAVPMVTIQASA